MATSTTTQRRPSKAKLQSRAVVRDVEAGSSVDCIHCGERVKFQAKVRNKQVICNVYIKGTWDRVEHYHAECYELAGSPFGEPDRTHEFRRASATLPPAS
jgi:hypothetical protein